MRVSELWENAAGIPAPADLESAERRWEQWSAAAESTGEDAVIEFARKVRERGAGRAVLDSVFGNSPFLSHCVLGDVEFAARLLSEGPDQSVADLLASVRDTGGITEESRSSLMRRLRKAKSNIAAAVAISDITSVWTVMQTTRALSDFASAALHASCSLLLGEEARKGNFAPPDPADPAAGSGLIVLGMGKLGAGELNFSSDVDLILLFDEEAAPVPDGFPQPLFSRLARNLVNVMAKRNEDGYVFRTDLRLRPDPNSTPPAVSTRAASTYYQTVGQTWERAAMIKARAIAGDYAAAERFKKANEGFIWRRNLDFASMRDIQAAKRQINAHRGSAKIAVEGHNVKLGRGGIREIEFFTQSQQLIWGGQNPELRGRETLSMLAALARTGRITSACAEQLGAAYEFLRRVEHRIQMTDDQQTHSLPESESGVEKLATFLGYGSRGELAEDLVRQLEIVQLHYNGLLEHSASASADFDLDFESADPVPEALESLRGAGYEDPDAVWNMVRRWHAGKVRATGIEKARELLIELTPLILEAFAGLPEPAEALGRFDQFLGGLAQPVNLFAILSARPDLISLIADIIGAAPELSGRLRRNPGLLESAVQRDFEDLELPDDLGLEREMEEAARRGLVRLFYKLEFGVDEMASDLNAALDRGMPNGFDFQSMLDIQRRWAQERKFQVGVHLLRGYLTPLQAGEPLSGIAVTNLSVLIPVLKEQFAKSHGTVRGGQIAIIAFGKLGAGEMTMASDLDLIFVYSLEDGDADSDGPKPLPPTAYYARFCRRFLNAVTAPTSEGRLYEVDMGLRPSGRSGPIACLFEQFETYQREKADTRETMALAKARVIFSEGDLGGRVEDIIASVLTTERDPDALRTDVLAIRKGIDRQPQGGADQSIKYRPGGLLDLDSIAQFLQLRHAAAHPDILHRDSISVFRKAGDLGLLETAAASELAGATEFWRNLQGMLILTVGQDRRNDDAADALRHTLGRNYSDTMFETFTADIHRTASLVQSHYRDIIG